MSSLTQDVSEMANVIARYKSIPVLTTAMLADFYGTEEVRIRQGHERNKSRFIEGKHFFKIVGQELKDFASSLKILANDLFSNNSHTQISPKTRVLILWTERGAARHAKILDTDQAWDVFEQLEDCYFAVQEVIKQQATTEPQGALTTKQERVPLKDAVNMLVAKSKFLNYSDAYMLVHQRFGVEHVDQIPYDVLPVAVEYVHQLIGEYVPKVERIDPELKAFEILSSKVRDEVMNYVHEQNREIARLGGNAPKYPQFDEETIVQAFVNNIVAGKRMFMRIDTCSGKPILEFISPSTKLLRDNHDLTRLLSDSGDLTRDLLLEILQVVAKRLK